MKVILLNKPFQVLTRFTSEGGKRCLGDLLHCPAVYPAGRLDYDSEGLVLLTDHGPLQAQITDPRHAMTKVYWAQVEGTPSDLALAKLREGLTLSDGPTRPADARYLSEAVSIGPRDPPIRYRAHIPTHWLELGLREGRNRQVRRMTAAVGLPTLRLIRYAIGPLTLDGLSPGQHRQATSEEIAALEKAVQAPRRTVSGQYSSAGISASRPQSPARNSAAGRQWSGKRGPDRYR